MTTVGRLQKNGDLLLKGEIDERMPIIRDGLVSHHPLDDNSGAFDMVGGHQTIQNLEQGVNLVDAMSLDWKDPNSWYSINGSINNMSWDEDKEAIRIKGNNYLYLKTPIIVDTSKTYHIEAEIYQENDEAGSNTNVLYLGGHGLTVDGTRYTANYDYSITSNYDVPIGKWIRVGVIRSGTGGYASRTHVLNNGEDPTGTMGWTSTNGVCYRYHFGALFNYSGGSNSVIYIKNISIKIVDSDTSNVTPTSYGVAIEQSTTNISPYDGSFESCEGEHYGDVALTNGNRTTFSGDWQAGTQYNDGICKVMYDVTPQGYGKIFRWIHGSVTGWKGITSRYNWSANSTKTYTVSIYVRVNGQCSPSAYAFYGDTSHRLYFKWEKTPRLHQDEWVRGTLTFSPATSQLGGVYLYGDTTGEEGSTIDYALFQIEERDFGTSFVNESRGGEGRLEIPLDSGSNFTLFHKFIPRKDWATLLSGQSYGKRMWNLYDKNTGKKIWWEDYQGSSSTDGTSRPWIGFDEFVTTDSGHPWHWHNLNQDVKEGEEYWIAVVKNGSTWTKYILTEDGQKVIRSNSITHNHSEVMAFSPSKIELRPDYNWLCRDLSFFDRALSQNEIEKLAGNKFSPTSTGDVYADLKEDESEWQLVWQGLASKSRYPSVESEDEIINIYGDDIKFNQMKITSPCWAYEVQADTSKTAVLKNSFKWYSGWLGTQPDTPSPYVKFHGEDGVQNVGFKTPTAMLFGYGNNWRRITPIHYVSSHDSMYHGTVPSYIKKDDWYTGTGDSNYQSGMDKNEPRESGRFGLTPREFNTIQVWVRMNPNMDESKKMRNKDQKTIIKGHVIENVDLSQ